MVELRAPPTGCGAVAPRGGTFQVSCTSRGGARSSAACSCFALEAGEPDLLPLHATQLLHILSSPLAVKLPYSREAGVCWSLPLLAVELLLYHIFTPCGETTTASLHAALLAGTPFSARWSLTSDMETSLRWKIPAASACFRKEQKC